MTSGTNRGSFLDIPGVIAIFMRRAWILGVTLGIALAVSLSIALLSTPRYTAQAGIQIQLDKASAADIDTSTTQASQDQAQIDTEVDIIRSPQVARDVVQQLNLQADPEFANPRAADPLAGAASNLLSKVVVARDPESYLVGVTATSKFAAKAAAIANAFAQQSLDRSAEQRSRTAAIQVAALARQLSALSEDIAKGDAQISSYRVKSGIVQGTGTQTITDQELAPLTSELAQAQSDAAARNAELAQARSRGSDKLETPLVNDLRRQRAEVVRKRGELSSRLGPNHPDLIAITKQLSDIDAQIQQETSRGYSDLASKAGAANSQLAAIKGRMAALQAQQNENSTSNVAAQALERVVDAKRRVYNQLAQAQQHAEQEARTSQPIGRLVQPAVAPDAPSYPKKALLLLLGALVGSVSGLAIILLLEALDHRLRSGKEIEEVLKTPLVTSVPLLSPSNLQSEHGQGMPPWDYAFHKPMSMYSEALRTARRSLALKRKKKECLVVAICSSMPAEGKTNFSASLGRIMAMSGDKVLLIDGDLRRSSLSAFVDREITNGLAEVLTEDFPVDEAIVNDSVTPLEILPLSSATFRPDDVLRRDRTQAMLDTLRQRYEYILIDTPPILAVDDGRGLAVLADQVLLLIRWNGTTTHAAKASIRRLREDGAPLLGAILTMFERKAGAMAPGEAVYYHKALSNYYRE